MVVARDRHQRVEKSDLVAVLEQLTSEDSRLVYEAIRLANPGGLGDVDQQDVKDDAPERLLDAMQLAQDRDLIARQYVNGFADVIEVVCPALLGWQECLPRLSDAIVLTHVEMLARWPDSLIARKCGIHTANHAMMLAQKAIDEYRMDVALPDQSSFWKQVSDLDFWLRSDGHRRNPGTTADLIGSALFRLLANGELKFSGSRNG